MKADRSLLVVVLLLAFVFAGLCSAQDIIKLKNGNSFRGIIRESSGDMIRVEIKAGMMMTFPKSDVAEIIRGQPPPRRQSLPPNQKRRNPSPRSPQSRACSERSPV